MDGSIPGATAGPGRTWPLSEVFAAKRFPSGNIPGGRAHTASWTWRARSGNRPNLSIGPTPITPWTAGKTSRQAEPGSPGGAQQVQRRKKAHSDVARNRLLIPAGHRARLLRISVRGLLGHDLPRYTAFVNGRNRYWTSTRHHLRGIVGEKSRLTRKEEDRRRRQNSGCSLPGCPGLAEPRDSEDRRQDEAHLADGDHRPRFATRQGRHQQDE